jgi:hypothetical protein
MILEGMVRWATAWPITASSHSLCSMMGGFGIVRVPKGASSDS